jgi:hypothetical protein
VLAAAVEAEVTAEDMAFQGDGPAPYGLIDAPGRYQFTRQPWDSPGCAAFSALMAARASGPAGCIGAAPIAALTATSLYSRGVRERDYRWGSDLVHGSG